jgi:hypothetical protein
MLQRIEALEHAAKGVRLFLTGGSSLSEGLAVSTWHIQRAGNPYTATCAALLCFMKGSTLSGREKDLSRRYHASF